jgi:lipopolysaccharide cholinephosphotransferase
MIEDLTKYNPEGSDLRKAQLLMLEILIEVSKICDKNNIAYWISFGTLLGAVRHKGFIPWDDDLDIEVKSKDFKKLLKCLESDLPFTMKLQYEGNDKAYFNKYCKVRDTNSVIHELGSENFGERGVFIDIFPREYSTKILRTLSIKILGRSLIYSKSMLYKEKRRTLIQRFFLKTRILVYNLSITVNNILSKIFPFKKLFTPSFNMGVSKEIIFPLKEIAFEGHNFKCPANVDAYLKLYYGDYMKLPSPENRITHATKIEFN